MPPRAPGRWITASELAEYAYCPRAWWYRGHPPKEGPSADSIRGARRGTSYHTKALSATRVRDRSAVGLVAAAAATILVIALLVASFYWP